MSAKVYVTGIGMLSPYGRGLKIALESISQRRFAYGPLSNLDCSTIPVKVGGVVPDDAANAPGLMHNKLRGMGKYVKLGVVAARDALDDAGLSNLKEYPANRIGAFVSSGTHGHNAEGLFGAFDVSRGPDETLDLAMMAREGIDCVHPWWLLSTISNNLIFFVTHFLGIKGPNTNVCNSAVGGAYVLDRALESLHSGEIDIALVGGADCPINWQILSDLSLMKFLAEGSHEKTFPMKPFSPSAAGSVLSEGAVFLVCETAESLQRRSAKAYAEITRTTFSNSFSHEIKTAEDGREIRKVLETLLESVPASDGCTVNVAANGVPDWDKAEQRGLEAALSTRSKFGFGSPKTWLGNAFSASFLLETAVAMGALKEHRLIPFPEINALIKTPDAGLPLAGDYQWGINLGQCFGGNTAGVLWRRV